MNGRPVSAFHLSSLRRPGRAAPFATILIALFAITPLASAQESARPILLSDDGAWCWFQDERALVYDRTLLVGAVANGTSDKSRRGDIDLLVCDIDSRRVTRYELHDQFEADDRAAPALLRLPDGRLLAAYSKHACENCFYGASRAPPTARIGSPSSRSFPASSRPLRIPTFAS